MSSRAELSIINSSKVSFERGTSISVDPEIATILLSVAYLADTDYESTEKRRAQGLSLSLREMEPKPQIESITRG